MRALAVASLLFIPTCVSLLGSLDGMIIRQTIFFLYGYTDYSRAICRANLAHKMTINLVAN